MNKYTSTALELVLARCRAAQGYRAVILCGSQGSVMEVLDMVSNKLLQGESVRLCGGQWLNGVVEFPNGSSIGVRCGENGSKLC
jgi:hypothetical protein